MKPEFSDEVISAYLDGELTAEEQAQVEEALMNSAEHRRTFEELRALRRSLQSLPAERLDAGFAERVLRRAEKEMLVPRGAAGAEGDESATSGSAAAEDDGAVIPMSAAPAKPPRREVPIRRWVVLVTSAAIAASLLLVVFVQPEWFQPNVAVNENGANGRSSSSADNGQSGDKNTPAVLAKKELDANEGTLSPLARDRKAAQGLNGQEAFLQSADDSRQADIAPREQHGAGPQGDESGEYREIDGRRSAGARGGYSSGSGQFAGGGGLGGELRDDAAPFGGSAGGARGASPPAARRFGGNDRPFELEEGAADQTFRALAVQGEGDEGATALAGAPMYVVTVEVTAEELRSRELDSTFARHNIVMQPPLADPRLALREPTLAATLRESAAAAQSSPLAQLEAADSSHDAKDESDGLLDALARGEAGVVGDEYVLVQASHESVQKALNDLQSQPDRFRQIELHYTGEGESLLTLQADDSAVGNARRESGAYEKSQPLEDGDQAAPPAAADALGPGSAPSAPPQPAAPGGRGRFALDKARPEPVDALESADEPKSANLQRDSSRPNARPDGEQSRASKKESEELPGVEADRVGGGTAASAAFGAPADKIPEGFARRLAPVVAKPRAESALPNANEQPPADGVPRKDEPQIRDVPAPAGPPPGVTESLRDREDAANRGDDTAERSKIHKSDQRDEDKVGVRDGATFEHRAGPGFGDSGAPIAGGRAQLEAGKPQRVNVLFVIRVLRSSHAIEAAAEPAVSEPPDD